MGTIVRRDDNKGKVTFQAKIRRVNVPSLSKTFSTKKEAERWLTENELALLRGESPYSPQPDTAPAPSAASETTFRQAIERYIEEVTPKKRSASGEVSRLRALARSDMADSTLGNLTPAIIAKWRDERLKEVAGSTVHRDMASLSHVFEIARKEWGIAPRINPFKDVAKPKVSNARDRRLSPEEEVRLLKACSESRGGYLRQVVELALETAMRQSELVGLDWQYVDMNARVAKLLMTKNGTSRRVPLSRRAIEILEGLPAERDKEGRRVGPVWPGLTAEALKRSFIRTTERAKIEDFHFHDLRHEATSRLFEKGLSMMEVATITGHKTLAMLQRYTHLDAADIAKKL